MARINIEECWWSDPRRSKLARMLGDDELADARALRMWRLAQRFWESERRLVPLEIFETLSSWEELIQCRLAEVRNDQVYVRGSSQYLDWSYIEKEKRVKGGKNSANGRERDEHGHFLPRKEPANVQLTSSYGPANASNVQVSGSGSSSSSSFFSKNSMNESMSESLCGGELEENKKEIVQCDNQDPAKSPTLIQEARFRLAKEITEVEGLLAAMFPGGQVPKPIKKKIPSMLIRCNGSAEDVKEVLDDLYQNPKVRIGEGLNGSRANYVAVSILERFELRGDS